MTRPTNRRKLRVICKCGNYGFFWGSELVHWAGRPAERVLCLKCNRVSLLTRLRYWWLGYSGEAQLKPVEKKPVFPKTIDLQCHGIVITEHENGVSSIVDGLHEENCEDSYNDMIDAITSLILAHYCAGVDVTTPAYLEGIETAIDNCANMA